MYHNPLIDDEQWTYTQCEVHLQLLLFTSILSKCSTQGLSLYFMHLSLAIYSSIIYMVEIIDGIVVVFASFCGRNTDY